MENKKQFVVKFGKILLVIIWMIVVFRFSSEVGDDSSNTSGITITKILTLFKKNWNPDDLRDTVELLQPFVRKIAHFTLYTLGGFLIYNIRLIKSSLKKNLLISVIIGCIYSITDEIHQLFVPGRTGLATDVLIDTLGVTTGCIGYIILFKIMEKIKYKKQKAKKS